VAVEGGKGTASLVSQLGGEAVFVRADVSRAANVQALINRAVETFGRLDCGFNNAGIAGTMAATAEYNEDDWDQVLSINLKGVWLCMKYEILQMLKQGGGAIVNTSSVAGLAGVESSSAYAASSHGIIGLSKSAALEYAKAGIRVNAICPGVIRTPMIERIIARRPEAEARMAALQPLNRMGTPEEVAEAALWLLSEGASFVTGCALAVDGGRLAK